MAGYNVLSCICAVGFVAFQGLGAGGVDGEDHARLTVLALGAVEPFWTSAVNRDGEGRDGCCVSTVSDRHEAGEGA